MHTPKSYPPHVALPRCSTVQLVLDDAGIITEAALQTSAANTEAEYASGFVYVMHVRACTQPSIRPAEWPAIYSARGGATGRTTRSAIAMPQRVQHRVPLRNQN